MLKIAVIGGFGAIGAQIVSCLTRDQNNAVSIISRNPNQKEKNITLNYPENKTEKLNKLSYKIITDLKKSEEQDHIIFATKAPDLTLELIEKVKPLIGHNTKIFIAQNGLPCWFSENLENVKSPIKSVDPEGKILKAFGKEKVIEMVLYDIANNKVDENTITVRRKYGESRIIVGEPLENEESERCKEFKKLFQNTSIRLEVTRDIRTIVMQKLLVNMVNPVCAVMQKNIGDALKNEEAKKKVFNSVDEVQQVAKALNIEKLPSNEELLERWVNKSKLHMPSMCYDLLNGMATETPYLIGGVVELAELLNIETPILKEINEKMKKSEESLKTKTRTPQNEVKEVSNIYDARAMFKKTETFEKAVESIEAKSKEIDELKKKSKEIDELKKKSKEIDELKKKSKEIDELKKDFELLKQRLFSSTVSSNPSGKSLIEEKKEIVIESKEQKSQLSFSKFIRDNKININKNGSKYIFEIKNDLVESRDKGNVLLCAMNLLKDEVGSDLEGIGLSKNFLSLSFKENEKILKNLDKILSQEIQNQKKSL